jgi:hypothetical protein
MNFCRINIITSFIAFLALQTNYAQTPVPFIVKHQASVRGDMTIISNSIVNRIDKKYAPNQPYNDQSIDAVANDAFDMEYIDIDNDPKTFSSSSAALFVKNEQAKKIVYAGLYWSGTYKYESGYKKGEDKFTAYDDDRFPVGSVAIKLPKQSEYIPIQGEVIYDGVKDKNFRDSAPYAAFADITEYVKALENPFGFYTVANVRATQGTLFGGTAAGWTIVFIYEDASMSQKHFTTYNGFAGISNNSVDVPLTGFKTPSQGAVLAKVAGAAIEGDFTVSGDMIYFSSSSNPTLYNIKSGIRKTSNFFNSSITIDNEPFVYRIPDGINTLGYDSFLMNIDNPNNKYIGNDVTSATIRYKSTGDQLFIFFTAFCVEGVEDTPQVAEISEPETQVILQDDRIKIVDKTTHKTIHESKPLSTPPNPNNVVAESQPNARDEVAALIEEMNQGEELVVKDATQQEQKIKITKLSNISALKGYYTVANVFSDRNNAVQFMMKLREVGLNPNYFINPKNNYLYVYTHYSKDKNLAVNAIISKMNNLYLEQLWLTEVNID